MNDDIKLDQNVLNYRLSSIENEIKNLKDLLIEVPILVQKLDSLSTDTKEELVKLNDKIDISNANIEKKLGNVIDNETNRIETKINNEISTLKMEIQNIQRIAERRLETVEINQDLITKELTRQKEEVLSLKNAPDKKAASKMNYIFDYVFKTIVGVVVAWLLISIGLGGF